jgi:hypothetical protein
VCRAAYWLGTLALVGCGAEVSPVAYSDPVPAGEVPPCIAQAPSRLEGYTHVALYRFEEDRGRALVDTTRTGQGTLHGGLRTEGQCGQAVTFEAEDAHLELSAVGPVFGGGIAVGIWVRPSSTEAGEAHLVGDGGGGVATFQLVLVQGIPTFRISTRGGWRDLLRAAEPLEPNEWHYLQATYDLEAGSLFIDGSEAAQATIAYPMEGSYNTIYAGAIRSTTPCCSFAHRFRGNLDEIAIYRAGR